jgi:hypothetical protein
VAPLSTSLTWAHPSVVARSPLSHAAILRPLAREPVTAINSGSAADFVAGPHARTHAASCRAIATDTCSTCYIARAAGIWASAARTLTSRTANTGVIWVFRIGARLARVTGAIWVACSITTSYALHTCFIKIPNRYFLQSKSFLHTSSISKFSRRKPLVIQSANLHADRSLRRTKLPLKAQLCNEIGQVVQLICINFTGSGTLRLPSVEFAADCFF